MKLKNISVQVGGFHDHWLRNGTDTSAVLIAAVTKYHYDFICLMDGEFGDRAKRIKNQLEMWIPGFRAYIGMEKMYGWGHIVTVENACSGINMDSPDYKTEMKKFMALDGISALAHIGYPSTLEKITKTGIVDELIDGDYVDAIQIENAADWEYIKKRAASGKKLSLISGWDSHMLLEAPELPNCIYNKKYGITQHWDHSSFMRTIVFCEDNSLESIHRALKAGKSVLEEIDTGRMYGSPELIALLEENEYAERMHELDIQYEALDMTSEPLRAFRSAQMRFPGQGTVTYAQNADLMPAAKPTDADGNVYFDSLPMPAVADESYLPFLYENGKTRRYWAVRILNDIQLRVAVMFKNGKRVLSVYANQDFAGTLYFREPISQTISVTARKGETLYDLEIGKEIPQIFYYEFTAESQTGNLRPYSGRAALVTAQRFEKGWQQTEELHVDREEFCGGYGSNRPYPGKDVFSFEARFLWDEENLYAQWSIIDGIYVSPPEGQFMFLSDSTCLNIDPLLAKLLSRAPGCEMLIGMPDGEGEIFCTHAPALADGTKIVGYPDNSRLSGRVTMEKTPNGRIVTAEIPWSEITPRKVCAGDHMGITTCAINDEGDGAVDNMQWPWPPVLGGWLFPDQWGVLALI